MVFLKKYLLILYLIASSIFSFYLLGSMRSVVVEYSVLLGLLINVFVVVPIILYRKLEIEERRKFNKITAVLSLALAMISWILLHIFDSLGLLFHSWANHLILVVGTTFLITLLITVKLFLLFLATLYIVIKYKNNYKKLIKTTLWSISFNYIFPFYSIVLIVWWIFNLSEMIFEILR